MEDDYYKKVKCLAVAENSSCPSAAEVYAADALFILSDDSQVIEAANILPIMVSEDGTTAAQGSYDFAMRRRQRRLRGFLG